LSFLRLGPLFSFLAASAIALACGGADHTDFDNDDGSVGGSSGDGGSSPGGTGQGGAAGTASGSGGSSQGGSSQGGSSQGGSDPTGGSSGNASGGASGTATGGGTTGGTAGTDGGTGSGGTLGGTGPGGSGGASGRAGGGTGGNDCAAIVASAQAALLAAQVCNPAQSSPICTGSVEDLCGCTVPVNQAESTATKSYLTQREAALRCGVPCLAIPCREPTTAMCGIGAVNRIVVQAHCVYSPR
jgi:hypothetical protein